MTQCPTDLRTAGARYLIASRIVVVDNAVGSVIKRLLHLWFLWRGPYGLSAFPCCFQSDATLLNRKLEEIFFID